MAVDPHADLAERSVIQGLSPLGFSAASGAVTDSARGALARRRLPDGAGSPTTSHDHDGGVAKGRLTFSRTRRRSQ